ncbi:MAG: hypothetical protein JSR80_05670 [Verrucomicrobia bacterium]|nr:hypothetical protein [Verrucomicrobiota bacterium]
METVHASASQRLQHDKLQELISQRPWIEDYPGITAEAIASALTYHPLELAHLPQGIKQEMLNDAVLMSALYDEGFAESAIDRLGWGDEEFSLNLSGSKVSTDFFHVFHRLPGLTRLDLSGCPNITNEGLQVVAEHAYNLTHLDLRDCDGITRKGVKLLRDVGIEVEW